MSFIEKARIALLDRRSRMDQELLKPVPPEKLQEFNNIIIQFMTASTFFGLAIS